MAARVPDISEFQLIQRYWDRANSYIRLKWTENGYTPEFSPLSELELAAERYENAENLRSFEAWRVTRKGLSGTHTAHTNDNHNTTTPTWTFRADQRHIHKGPAHQM
jgi:hypothetical protein